MEFHLGRLVDHVHLRVRDLGASRRFYEAALGTLGRELHSGEGYFWSDELFVSDDGPPTEHLHLAFETDGAETVARLPRGCGRGGRAGQRRPGRASVSPGLTRTRSSLDPDRLVV